MDRGRLLPPALPLLAVPVPRFRAWRRLDHLVGRDTRQPAALLPEVLDQVQRPAIDPPRRTVDGVQSGPDEGHVPRRHALVVGLHPADHAGLESEVPAPVLAGPCQRRHDHRAERRPHELAELMALLDQPEALDVHLDHTVHLPLGVDLRVMERQLELVTVRRRTRRLYQAPHQDGADSDAVGSRPLGLLLHHLVCTVNLAASQTQAFAGDLLPRRLVLLTHDVGLHLCEHGGADPIRDRSDLGPLHRLHARADRLAESQQGQAVGVDGHDLPCVALRTGRPLLCLSSFLHDCQSQGFPPVCHQSVGGEQ